MITELQAAHQPWRVTREVSYGASALGWAWSDDRGSTWVHVPPLDPPPGWALLWGDPAIARMRLNPSYVFISNVAGPDSKFPFDDGKITGGVSPYLGGACVARSTDGGKTFGMFGCLTNDDHFYDGGALAVGKNAIGKDTVYAAYLDFDDGQIDVWAGSALGLAPGFSRLPRPFEGMPVSTHPRLRVDIFDRLWVATTVGSGPDAKLMVAYWNDDYGIWFGVKDAAPGATVDPSIAIPMGNDYDLRSAPEFSFDFGQASSGFEYETRFVFTRRDPETNRYYLQGSRCDWTLSFPCEVVPAWRTSPGPGATVSDQFHPVISYGGLDPLSNLPVWMVSYYDRLEPNGASVAVRAGRFAELSNGTPVFVPRTIVESRPVCQDRRGYWGDYDDLDPLPPGGPAEIPTFIRAFSDSRPCNFHWEYTEDSLHVSAVIFR